MTQLHAPGAGQVRRHYLTVFGTRPEIIKLAPVITELRRRGDTVTVVNTAQHQDANMNAHFVRDLAVDVDVTFPPAPSPAQMPGWILMHACAAIAEANPDVLLLLGDTLNVPLFAWAGRRAGLPVVHLEAGLRSYNGRSLEEVNRRMTAGATSIHFTPTPLATALLEGEGVPPERIFTVGNTVTDALAEHGPARVNTTERRGILMTAHRASNVDSEPRLRAIVSLARQLGDLAPVRFPVHPRTAARLAEHHLDRELALVENLTLEGPLDYPDMLQAIASAQLVVTDSGGVQEECSWYGVPAIVLRRSTPRWEGVHSGAVALHGIDTPADVEGILADAARLLTPGSQDRVSGLPCPYGDGHVSARIADILASARASSLLALNEDAIDVGTLPWPS